MQLLCRLHNNDNNKCNTRREFTHVHLAKRSRAVTLPPTIPGTHRQKNTTRTHTHKKKLHHIQHSNKRESKRSGTENPKKTRVRRVKGEQVVIREGKSSSIERPPPPKSPNPPLHRTLVALAPHLPPPPAAGDRPPPPPWDPTAPSSRASAAPATGPRPSASSTPSWSDPRRPSTTSGMARSPPPLSARSLRSALPP